MPHNTQPHYPAADTATLDPLFDTPTDVLDSDLGVDPVLDDHAETVAPASELATVELDTLDDLDDLQIQVTETVTYPDFTFDNVIENLDLGDITGSLATLAAYRVPYVKAAREAGKKNPAAEYYHAVNTPLFNRRIALKQTVERLKAEGVDTWDYELNRSTTELQDITTLLVRLNYGIARQYVKQFTSNTSPEDSADFQGAANVGLMIAIDSFNPALGKFGSWAYKPIQRAVLKAVRDADFKNLNEGDFEKRPKVLKALRKLTEELPEDAPQPSYEEIAAEAGVHHELVRRVLAAPYLDSLHTTMSEDGGELGDLIPDEGARFEENVISQLSITALMEHGLKELDAREHYVLVRVFGLDGEAADALADIGQQLNLSREAVRQIRGKGMAKLLHPVTLRKLVRGGRD